MGITERKEKQKAELRQLILDAAVKLFSEHGYNGVTMRKIANVIEYSPTTVYLYFEDKNEILFELHEIGFKKLFEYNKNLFEIKNPLLRLYKIGENYMRFALENPEYYDLMCLLPAPIEYMNQQFEKTRWSKGDEVLDFLKEILQECMDKGLVKQVNVNTAALAIWGMVHGLVSLIIRKRFGKLMPEKDMVPAIYKAFNWIINTMDKTTDTPEHISTDKTS